MSAAFKRMATVIAATKRAPALSGGKRGAPALHLTALPCTPLDWVSSDLALRLGLDTPHTLRQTFIEGTHDVVRGDVLLVEGKEYTISRVEPWEWRGSTSYLLVVQMLDR